MSLKWRGATQMILISFSILLAVIAALWLWAPHIDAINFRRDVDPEGFSANLQDFRHYLLASLFPVLGGFILLHWLLAGMFGLGDIRRGRLANGLFWLALGLIVAMVIDYAFEVRQHLSFLCPPNHGLTSDGGERFSFDGFEPCREVGPPIDYVLHLGPLVLLLLSAVLRIVHSRRQGPVHV